MKMAISLRGGAFSLSLSYYPSPLFSSFALDTGSCKLRPSRVVEMETGQQGSYGRQVSKGVVRDMRAKRIPRLHCGSGSAPSSCWRTAPRERFWLRLATPISNSGGPFRRRRPGRWRTSSSENSERSRCRRKLYQVMEMGRMIFFDSPLPWSQTGRTRPRPT